MLKRNLVLLLGSIVMTLLVLTPLTACEPSHDVTIENGTSSALVIFVGIDKVGTTDPGKQITSRFSAPFGEWLISAKDASGKIVYSRDWTVDDLVKFHWKVVISP
jgi:hypothetical protein